MVVVAAEPVSAVEPLDVLLVRWDKFVWRLALRHARRAGCDPDDARADLLLALVTAHPSYDPTRGAFSTWCAVVARTTFGRVRRAPRTVSLSAPLRPGSESDVSALDVAADHRAADPADLAARGERADRVAAALATLPRAQRRAVLAAYWSGTTPGPADRRHLDDAIERLRDLIDRPRVDGGG